MRPKPAGILKSNILTKKIFEKITLPKPKTHKGQNGVTLVIGGSAKYHGAPLLAMLAASRFCDLVFFYSPIKENQTIANAIKPRLFESIGISKNELKRHISWADCVLVGNGMEDAQESRKLALSVLKTGKKCVLDAGALYPYVLKHLHENCLLTPHAGEFRRIFGMAATPANVQACAKKYCCTILCKTPECDIISDGYEMKINLAGNTGMTHGGTGDVLAGLACALCSNQKNVFVSACMAAHLNGLAGEFVGKKSGVFLNATDIANALPATLFKHIKKP